MLGGILALADVVLSTLYRHIPHPSRACLKREKMHEKP